MNTRRRRYHYSANVTRWCVPILLVMCATGCGHQGPLEYFKKMHSGGSAPHGGIVTETAKLAEDGNAIAYKTDDGSSWSVRFRALEDGYEYFGAEKVESDLESTAVD